jgi:hypothetical protein
MLFVVKLRRRVRAKVLVQDLADLESLSDGSGSNPMSKEVPLERRQSVATLKRGDRPWPRQDFRLELAQLPLSTFARKYHNFLASFSQVSRND